MSGWAALDEELAQWTALGRRCPLWLRDDDVVAATPALDRLLRLCDAAGIPLGLAAVAAQAGPELAEPLDRWGAATGRVALLVHGWTHRNHAAPGEKKSEFGAGRPAELRAAEAGQALARLCGLFGDRLLPLFVPPWNRMAADMPPHLAAAGYLAVSGFGRAPAAGPGNGPVGLRWINTHLDLIDWHGSRSAVALEPLLASLCRELRQRRDRANRPADAPSRP